ncbi:hypothetical protein ACIOML_20815 [Streptomyces anulatus]
MDQGLAGLLAGAAGLVGAGIGGLATAYGARVGAQKTIEAAQTQVAQQSAAEHIQWMRDQRRQVYSDLTALNASYFVAVATCSVELKGGRPLSSEQGENVKQRFLEIVESSARARLWGPDEVIASIDRVRISTASQVSALLSWSAAVLAENSEEMERRSQVFEAASLENKEARRTFTEAAYETLAVP